ncbi:hypothetical protein ACQCSA_24200, partial [Ralstonia pseudosolanacearum]
MGDRSPVFSLAFSTGGVGAFLFWLPPGLGTCGATLVSSPAGADLLFFVLPKKSRQKKGAPEMATPSLN